MNYTVNYDTVIIKKSALIKFLDALVNESDENSIKNLIDYYFDMDELKEMQS